MRRPLLVLLGFGVIAGYGSAFASARWHGRHCGMERDRWEQADRFDRRDFGRDFDRRDAAPVAAPQTVVVPQAAPAPAAPAPQVFVITVPSASAAPAPQVITVPVPTAVAAPAPAAAPAAQQ